MKLKTPDDNQIKRHSMPIKFYNHKDLTKNYSLIEKKIKNSKILKIFLEAKRDFKINNHELEKKIKFQQKKFKLTESRSFERKYEPLKISKKWKKLKMILHLSFKLKNLLYLKRLNGVTINLNNYSKNISEKSYKLISGFYIEKKLKKKKIWYLIYPQSTFSNFWCWINICLFIYTAFYMPFKLAFIDFNNAYLMILDFFIMFLFICDIFVSILTVYYKQEVLIDDFKVILVSYLKTWFIFDLISVFPFEYLNLFESKIFFLTKLPKLFKLLKIFRLLRLSENLLKNKKLTQVVNFFKINQQFNEFLFFFIIIILLTHITGCFWFFLTKLNENDNWITHYSYKANSITSKYFISFYWAISTICTVGFGDITPTNIIERFFNLIWIMVGVGFYSYTIGSLSSILNQLMKRKSIISSRFSFIYSMAKIKNIKYSILEKITINLENNKEEQNFDSNHINSNLFTDVSLDLTYKLAKKIYSKLIEKVVFFHHKDINFIAQLTPFITSRKFTKGTVIYDQYEYPSFVYFIIKGKIGFQKKTKSVFKEYVEGSYFGEIEIFKSCLRQYTAKVTQDAQLLLLPRDNFLKSLKNFPKIDEELHDISIKRDIDLKKSKEYSQKIRDIYINTKSFLKKKESLELSKIQRKMHKNIISLKNKILYYTESIGLKKYNTSELKPPKFHKPKLDLLYSLSICDIKENNFDFYELRRFFEICQKRSKYINELALNIYTKFKKEKYYLIKNREKINVGIQCDLDDPISTERLNLMNHSYVTEKYPSDDYINDEKDEKFNPLDINKNISNLTDGIENNNAMFLSFGPKKFEKENDFKFKKVHLEKKCLLKSEKFQKYKECKKNQSSNSYLFSEDSIL